MHQELQAVWRELPQDAPAELGAFIDVHALILSDPMISEAPLDIIRSRHYNAEWALVTQIDELSAQFDEIEDAYLRERKNDIQQVGRAGAEGADRHRLDAAPPGQLDGLDARTWWSSRTTSRRPTCCSSATAPFAGFVTDLGGQNSHTAIVARSLDIPAAVGMYNASALIAQDDWVIIDGDARRGHRQSAAGWCWSSTARARPGADRERKKLEPS